MKECIKFIAIMAIGLAIFAVPYRSEYTIDKETIKSIRPFAGVVANDTESYLVGTKLACKFWLEKDSLPKIATYRVTKPLALGWFGFEYKAEIIPHETLN